MDGNERGEKLSRKSNSAMHNDFTIKTTCFFTLIMLNRLKEMLLEIGLYLPEMTGELDITYLYRGHVKENAERPAFLSIVSCLFVYLSRVGPSCP